MTRQIVVDTPGLQVAQIFTKNKEESGSYSIEPYVKCDFFFVYLIFFSDEASKRVFSHPLSLQDPSG